MQMICSSTLFIIISAIPRICTLQDQDITSQDGNSLSYVLYDLSPNLAHFFHFPCFFIRGVLHFSNLYSARFRVNYPLFYLLYLSLFLFVSIDLAADKFFHSFILSNLPSLLLWLPQLLLLFKFVLAICFGKSSRDHGLKTITMITVYNEQHVDSKFQGSSSISRFITSN